MPLGREKQNTADMTGIMMFMVFMVLAAWSFASEAACGISLTFSHCVNAASRGMIRAMTIIKPPLANMEEGDSAILIPRKLLYWFSFAVVVVMLSVREDAFSESVVQSVLWNLFRISIKLFLIFVSTPASTALPSCFAKDDTLEKRYFPSAFWVRRMLPEGSIS